MEILVRHTKSTVSSDSETQAVIVHCQHWRVLGGCVETLEFCDERHLPNNNNHDDVYGAVITASSCKSLPGAFAECRLGTRWPPTLMPRQPT